MGRGYDAGEACPFIFVRASKLRESNEEYMPCLQVLRRERPDWLVERVLTMQGALGASFVENTLAVSHRWSSISQLLK